MDYPFGLDPYTCRQDLLQHHFSPLILVHASSHCDAHLQRVLGVDLVLMLQILKPYGNNAKYSVPRQNYKIVNSQLITKSYHSFPVRFDAPINEVLELQVHQNSQQLFLLTQLEMLLDEAAADGDSDDLYLKMFAKVISNNKVVAWETFNHPVAHIFFIEYGNDTVDLLRQQMVKFRNFPFPKYFLLDDMLMHVFVLYDPNLVSPSEITTFQLDIRTHVNLFSTALPIDLEEDSLTLVALPMLPRSPQGHQQLPVPMAMGHLRLSSLGTPLATPRGRARAGTANSVTLASSATAKYLKLPLYEGSSITEDLQRLSLGGQPEYIYIPKLIDRAIRTKLHEFLSKYVISHMQTKIRIWDDQYLQPKRLITLRFFSASRRMFGSPESTPEITASAGLYNATDQYYYRLSPEQLVRKLADWSLALKDFKFAYLAYELIKKDYSNDKAWPYVALTQAMCCISLLLSHTVLLSLGPMDRNTLRKIRHDIIEPYMDSCLYTLKLRLSLKTVALLTLLVVVELLLCFGISCNLAGWWNDLIQRYLIICITDVDGHLAANNYNLLTVVRALLYERVAYSLGRCIYLSDHALVHFNEVVIQNLTNNKPITLEDHKLISKDNIGDGTEEQSQELDDGYYVNDAKLLPHTNSVVAGKTRYRQLALWYLLAVREWLNMLYYSHIDTLFNNIKLVYDVSDIDPSRWYDRADLLLGFAKRSLLETAASGDGEENDDVGGGVVASPTSSVA